MQVVVYGAGAVGSVLGGVLSAHQHDVLLVSRKAHADAINVGGLRLKSATGEHVAHPRAVASLSRGDMSDGACVLLTVKSYDTAAAVDDLAAIIPVDTPVVCFQNGVVSESLAAGKFSRVYGGICRTTCSMVQPGNASFLGLGRVIVGAWPRGSDAFPRGLALAFREAGFDAAPSRAIESDLWLKLALNTQTVVHALVDARDHDGNEFQALKASLLEETGRVYKAAKVRARSCDGRDPSIEEMISELRRPRVRRSEHGVKVHNSLWQDLYLKRPRIESEYIHGPIIELGSRHGVATPYNTAMLDVVRGLHAGGGAPETLRIAGVLEAVKRQAGGE